MGEQQFFEQALGTTTGVKPPTISVQKSFVEKRLEEETKPIEVKIPEELLNPVTENPNTLQSIETSEANTQLEPNKEVEEQIEKEKKEAESEIVTEKKEVKEAISEGNDSVINAVLDSLFREKEELKFKGIDLEVENEYLKKTVQDLQKKLHSFKYDDDRLPVHEKSRSFYLTEIKYHQNPEDPVIKETYLRRLLERAEEVDGQSYDDKFNSWKNRGVVSSISGLSQNSNGSVPSLSNNVQPIQPRGVKVKRYF